MTRRPRKPDDHLVSARLLTHAYGQMGEIATAGAFFSYFTVMQLYGFPPNILFGLVNKSTIIPSVWNVEQQQFVQNPSFNSADCTFDQFQPNLGC